jgi:hypothetical protein
MKLRLVQLQLLLLVNFYFFCTSCSIIPRKNEIFGEWKLTDSLQINYTSLIFKNNKTSVFLSKGDTIFRFNYKINRSSIELRDFNNITEKYSYKILNKDTLTFDCLREIKKKVYYIRIAE